MDNTNLFKISDINNALVSSTIVDVYNSLNERGYNANSQIIGYKDSFGKVYSVVKKLDTVLPDQVFYEAVNILEELLEKYSDNMRMVDRIPDALSGAMGNQMYVATFPTKKEMDKFYSDAVKCK